MKLARRSFTLGASLAALGATGGCKRALREMRPELAIDGDPLLTTWADDPWARVPDQAPERPLPSRCGLFSDLAVSVN